MQMKPRRMIRRGLVLIESCLVGDAGVGWIYAEGCGERDEVVLLLHEYLADGLAEGEFVELVALLDAAAIVGDGLSFVFEIEAEHVFGFLGCLDQLWGDGGMPPR